MINLLPKFIVITSFSFKNFFSGEQRQTEYPLLGTKKGKDLSFPSLEYILLLGFPFGINDLRRQQQLR